MVEILYSDASIVVCIKPVGVASQTEQASAMPQLLSQQLGCETIYPVHRLDQVVGGVMVYAKTAQAAAELTRQLQQHTFQKEYLAVLRGEPQAQQDTLCDLLYHDRTKNKTFVVSRKRNGAREARLSYTCLQRAADSDGVYTLVRVQLHTGRTHQIRAQFASRKLPLLGDGKYGGGDNRCTCALWSYRLAFSHPLTKKQLTFAALPPESFAWQKFPVRELL